ncbi:putative ankyrin repeat protein RF_0381 [Coccinella septempunctata]|uniref:putative ankyrin repeat protein RF_0381 n=1 Tax=Coccinella septempunctata TaxID=41139 RepID=UPI001D06BECF|nr:putative ankyrin repeat protein RF_0381 [Coccinella septempunctata]XP_044752810.1 putative ankyrin repeat protein RF_0381 [Coccinella septempunctata]
MSDPNRRLTKCGSTALHLAVKSCSVEIVRKLLEKGADVNTPVHRCAPVFHVAVMCDRLDLINLLVQHGADPRQPSAEGLTVLHRVESGKMVRKLITYGLDINEAAPPEGDTPLRNSILSYCDDDVIKAFLECGADYKIDNNWGFTAFDFMAARLISGSDFEEIIRMGSILLDHVTSNVPEDVNDPETKKIRRFGEELRQLKSEKIGNTSITYWKLINTRPRKAASFFDNEESLVKPDIKKFSFFGRLIESRIREGLDYNDMENYARGFIKEITSNRLPWNCINKIITFLHADDLKSLRRFLSLEK